MAVGQGDEFGVAVGIGADGDPGQYTAGAGVEDRGGVGVFVSVDADDDLGDICQHGHAFFSLPGEDAAGPGPVRRWQDCDETRQPLTDGQAPDQANIPGRAGAGSSERTSPVKGTKPVRPRVTPTTAGCQPIINEPTPPASQSGQVAEAGAGADRGQVGLEGGGA